VGVELDPREEKLDTVQKVVIVLSLDTSSSLPTCDNIRLEQSCCLGKTNLRTCLHFVLSFLLSHYRQPSDTKAAGRESFPLLYFSFLCFEDREAGH
jgi:hypothetical protein